MQSIMSTYCVLQTTHQRLKLEFADSPLVSGAVAASVRRLTCSLKRLATSGF